MQAKTLQQIQIINSNRTAKSTDRYLDPAGNIWVGEVSGRLFIPPFSTELPTSKTDGALSVEQRLLDLEASVGLVSGIAVKETQVNFGNALYQKDGIFTVFDSDATSSSVAVAQIAYKAPTGKDVDEVTMDEISVRCGCLENQVVFSLSSTTGSLYGNFWISYTIKN